MTRCMCGEDEHFCNCEGVIPKLVSSTGVAKILGILRSNMFHQRKVKGFPTPVTQVDNKPLWLETDVLKFKEIKDRESELKPIEKMTIEEVRMAGRFDELILMGGERAND